MHRTLDYRRLRSVLLSVFILSCALIASAAPHSADVSPPAGTITLSELLRVIQFFNSAGFHCATGSEDNFAPGNGDKACAPHDSDYNPRDWVISLKELLRLVQIFNSNAYHVDCTGEDGFLPGPGPLDLGCGPNVVITPNQATLFLGETLALSVISDTTGETYNWQSANTDVVVVDPVTGLVSAVGPGTTIVEATGSPSGATGSTEITVNTVAIAPLSLVINVGTSAQLDIETLGATDGVYWESSNDAIVTVTAEGLVHAVSTGQAAVHLRRGEIDITSPAPVAAIPPDVKFGAFPEIVSMLYLGPEEGGPAYLAELENGLTVILDDPVSSLEEEHASPDFSTPDFLEKGEEPRPEIDFVLLSNQQTGFKNQRSRGTCVSFAVLAAMEARYKLLGYGDRDLSEQYRHHISKMVSLDTFDGPGEMHTRTAFENQFPMRGGGNIYGALDLATVYGIPEEGTHSVYRSAGGYEDTNQAGDIPRIDFSVPRSEISQRIINDFCLNQIETAYQVPNEIIMAPLPQEALESARHRVTGYVRAGSRLRDISWYENRINEGHEIIISANWKGIGDGLTNVRYPDPNPDMVGGSHATLIVGYNRMPGVPPHFIVKNSHGERDADGDPTYKLLSYDWVTTSVANRITGAAYITGVSNPDTAPSSDRILALGRWDMESDLFDGPCELDIIRLSEYYRYETLNSEDLRLGVLWDPSGSAFRVNGRVNPYGRLEFYIDPDEPNLPYGQASGHTFFGYPDGDVPTLYAGLQDGAGGFYASKEGLIDSTSPYAAPGSADAFLGRWRFVSSLIPGHLDIVDANDGVLSAVYRPDLENSASILGEAAAETGRVTFDLPDHTAPTGGKFIGYTLETQPGIIAGYYVLSDGWRFGAVLARERFVETELNILQPLPGASFLIGEAIPLQVSVYGDGLEITDTAEINWTLDAPLSVGGTLVAAGVNTFTSFEFPGDYTLFANYTGTPQSTASVTISVRAGSAPNVEITSPANGTLLADVGGGDPYPFYRASFSATATDGEDGVLSGASLRWSYRRLGATTWIDTGLTGTEVVIPLEDVDVSCITGTTYEVRVQATDSDMSVASDINQVRIAVIFCK